MAISKKDRVRIEKKIYDAFDQIDKSGTNSEHYRKLFASMSDRDFEKLMKSDFPYRFHHKAFVVEPTMQDVIDGLNFIGVPLTERISQEYKYVDAQGRPVYTKECIVFIEVKRYEDWITYL